MRTSPRLALAATLLALCGAPAARPQATNIPTAVARTMTVSTNGVVKAPKTVIYWPTQTNYFHRATVTNLFAGASSTTGNATIGGTLGVTGASTLASAGITGNATIGGTLGVTGTITGPGSGITGVLAANVPIVDAGGLITATHVEGALAELATGLDAVDVSAYVAKAGSTMTGALDINFSQPELLVTSSDAWHSSLILSRAYDASYPNIYSKIWTVEGTSGELLSEIKTTQTSATQSKLTFFVDGAAGDVVTIGPTNITFAANIVAADISSPAGTISAGVGFSGPGSALTSLTAGNLVGDVPAGGLGETAIQWSSRDFIKEDGGTNSVGWVEYTNTTGSRRFSIDALGSSISTDQAVTIRSVIKRVPRGFTAFKTTGALRITWVSSDSNGECELRGYTLTGWSDITGSETVLHTYSGALDVTAAGTPTVVSINPADFSPTPNPSVPQWIAIDLVFSVEDLSTGDKTGVLLVEVLSQ